MLLCPFTRPAPSVPVERLNANPANLRETLLPVAARLRIRLLAVERLKKVQSGRKLNHRAVAALTEAPGRYLLVFLSINLRRRSGRVQTLQGFYDRPVHLFQPLQMREITVREREMQSFETVF